VHHFEHSRDDLLQEICLFADNFVYDLVRKRQYALQPIENDRWNLVVFILFLPELDRQTLPSAPNLPIPVPSTNLKCHPSKPEDNLCNGVQLIGVSVLLVRVWEN
jgi:hypothetical protein